MEKEDMMLKIGRRAFLIGILIALIVGLYQAYTIASAEAILFTTDAGGWVAWLLAIIGAIVGILAFFGKGTITKKEIPTFLLAGISLVVMAGVFERSYTFLEPFIGALLSGISMSLSYFVAPAVGILAIKVIYDIGKD